VNEVIAKAMFHCPLHGDYSGETSTLNIGNHRFEINTMCPVCEREEKDKQEREQSERLEKMKIQNWRLMHIDQLFYDSCFDNFNAYNVELREHLETCRAFADNPVGKLVMIGENGNGKTHLAISILKKTGGVIYTAYEIGEMLNDCYNGKGSRWELFNELCTVPLLVIDEVEKIKDSGAKQNWMSHVVGKRYNRMLPTIFIANCHVKSDCTELNKPCPQCLEYHLENDIISRIVEDGKMMKFSSDDYRYKKRRVGERRSTWS
jgi:DNA replication protein DnaC